MHLGVMRICAGVCGPPLHRLGYEGKVAEAHYLPREVCAQALISYPRTHALTVKEEPKF
jgi:hypothetical protein